MNGKLTDSIISDRDQNPDYHVAWYHLYSLRSKNC
jgi:hypothetical protein